MNNIIPLTIEEIYKLPMKDKYKALRDYKVWLAKERKQSKKEKHRIESRVYLVKIMRDPIKKKIYVDKRREAHQQIKLDPERYAKYRLRERERYAKLKTNPERYEAYLARMRIYYKNRRLIKKKERVYT